MIVWGNEFVRENIGERTLNIVSVCKTLVVSK